MTRVRLMLRWSGCAVAAFVLAGLQASGQVAKPNTYGFVSMQPDELKPRDGETSVLIMGDPTKAGLYVLRNTFTPGRTSTPHFHSQDRYITVIKGTWWVHMGPESDVYDPSKMVPMKAGSFVFHPANGHHYDGAKDEEVTVQIMGMGPVTTTPIPQPK